MKKSKEESPKKTRHRGPIMLFILLCVVLFVIVVFGKSILEELGIMLNTAAETSNSLIGE